ncbi:endochitinase 4-like [Salvia splendens]|uniref:endochitinase 4-like n=1 Tax=Salvia splendens TaxID=180675 RepID=UPI001C2538C4|nr:endochitinase 4-like [Salvia splendens]
MGSRDEKDTTPKIYLSLETLHQSVCTKPEHIQHSELLSAHATAKGRDSTAVGGFFLRWPHIQPSELLDPLTTPSGKLAAFFVHVAHETGKNGEQSKPYCDPTYSKWLCAANKHYYGRGPLKLTWNYNYGVASRAIGFNLLKNPELVATNALVSIKASIWFWMENCHGPFISGKGFGATIRAINSTECDGKRTTQVSSRVKYYEDYCKQLRC